MGIRSRIRELPRSSSAIGFGVTAAVVTHFAWIPLERFSGAAPLVTMSAGLAHAAAGALVGGRLLDTTRTQTPYTACVLGGVTSLLALVPFSVAFAMWVATTNGRFDLFSSLLLIPLVAFFAFLAAGWALFIVSMAVAWGLFHAAHPEYRRQKGALPPAQT